MIDRTIVAGTALQVHVPVITVVEEGQQTTVLCTVLNYNGSTDFNWTRVGDNDFYQQDQTLTINETKVQDAGNYTCSVKTAEVTPQFGSNTTQLLVACIKLRSIFTII